MNLLHGSSVQQVSAYAHADYWTIVKRSCVDVVEANFTSGSILEHRERSFQHARVCLRNDEQLTSIVNCHAPLPVGRTLTNESGLYYLQRFHTVSGETTSFAAGTSIALVFSFLRC